MWPHARSLVKSRLRLRQVQPLTRMHVQDVRRKVAKRLRPLAQQRPLTQQQRILGLRCGERRQERLQTVQLCLRLQPPQRHCARTANVITPPLPGAKAWARQPVKLQTCHRPCKRMCYFCYGRMPQSRGNAGSCLAQTTHC